MKKIPSVTFFACAYNEEGNIRNFLKSVLSQKEEGFRMKKIVIVSDGSTDRTAKIVKSFESKKIHFIEHEKRIGKSTRLNDIYRNLDTDILVQSDADVQFKGKMVIARLIAPLTASKMVGLCGGNPIAVSGETFIEKSINITHSVYRKFRGDLKGGHNVFSADGRLLALSRTFANNLYIPPTMIANDMFAYFSCISKGFKYQYVKDAIVYYRSPQTLKDHIRQNTRFEAGPLRMEKYFEKSLVESELKIPLSKLFLYTFFEFIKAPHMAVTILMINIFCRVQAKLNESKMNAKWNMAITTKSL